METIRQNTEKPIYDSAALGSPVMGEIRGVLDNLFIVRRMIITNFKTRYKRSYLGMVWSMLNPLLNMIIYVVVFSFIFHNSVEHYPLYVLTGQMIFAYFRESTSESMMQMIHRSQLMRHIYMPKSIYVLSSVGINFCNLILTFIPFLLIAVFDRLTLSWTMLMIIPCLLLLTMFNVGISLLLATVIPFFADFQQIWNVLLTMWMYLTPIFYPISIISPRLLPIYKLNPLFVFVTIFREALIYGTVSSPLYWLEAGVLGVAALWIGTYYFTKHSNDFAYRI